MKQTLVGCRVCTGNVIILHSETWGLFHKPWNKDPVMKQPILNGIRIQLGFQPLCSEKAGTPRHKISPPPRCTSVPRVQWRMWRWTWGDVSRFMRWQMFLGVSQNFRTPKDSSKMISQQKTWFYQNLLGIKRYLSFWRAQLFFRRHTPADTPKLEITWRWLGDWSGIVGRCEPPYWPWEFRNFFLSRSWKICETIEFRIHHNMINVQ